MSTMVKNDAPSIGLPTFPLHPDFPVGLRTPEEVIWLMKNGCLYSGNNAAGWGRSTIAYDSEKSRYTRSRYNTRHARTVYDATGSAPWSVVSRPFDLFRWNWFPSHDLVSHHRLDTLGIPLFPLLPMMGVESREFSYAVSTTITMWMLERGILVSNAKYTWESRYLIRMNEGAIELFQQFWDRKHDATETLLRREDNLDAIQRYLSEQKLCSPFTCYDWIPHIFMQERVRAWYKQGDSFDPSKPVPEKLPQCIQGPLWQCAIAFGRSVSTLLPEILHQVAICQAIEKDWQKLAE